MAAVLIADGDADIRACVRLLLQDAGYVVLEAADAGTALRLLRSSAKPMVVLLNHFRTGMTSADVLQAASDDPAVARHAFVFVTTSAERLPPDLSLLVLSLALPVIGKPFDIDVLLAAVRGAEQKVAVSDAATPSTQSTLVCLTG